MKFIPLSGGQGDVTVDDEDYDVLSGTSWCLNTKGYAQANSKREDGRGTTVKMHRIIMNAPEGAVVDHINRNKLDNRRSNLRLATHSQNQQNVGLLARNTTGYKGVFWYSWSSKWLAQINVDRKRHHLGYFLVAEDAARAYDRAAIKLHGEFAVTNAGLGLL